MNDSSVQLIAPAAGGRAGGRAGRCGRCCWRRFCCAAGGRFLVRPAMRRWRRCRTNWSIFNSAVTCWPGRGCSYLIRRTRSSFLPTARRATRHWWRCAADRFAQFLSCRRWSIRAPFWRFSCWPGGGWAGGRATLAAGVLAVNPPAHLLHRPGFIRDALRRPAGVGNGAARPPRPAELVGGGGAAGGLGSGPAGGAGVAGAARAGVAVCDGAINRTLAGLRRRTVGCPVGPSIGKTPACAAAAHPTRRLGRAVAAFGRPGAVGRFAMTSGWAPSSGRPQTPASPSTTGSIPTPTARAISRTLRNLPELRAMSEAGRNAYFAHLARQYALAHPARVATLAAAKVGRLWSPVPLSADYGADWRYLAVGLGYTVPLFAFALLGVCVGPLPPGGQGVFADAGGLLHPRPRAHRRLPALPPPGRRAAGDSCGIGGAGAP